MDTQARVRKVRKDKGVKSSRYTKERSTIMLHPFCLYVMDTETQRGDELSRSGMIDRVIREEAERRGYTEEDPEFQQWLSDNGYQEVE